MGRPEIPDGPIGLVEHDDTWRALSAREADRIRGALGDRARSIQHVGSTAVPGLAAKPRIDMLVEVADTDDEDRYLPPLEVLGYVISVREPDWHRHRGLKHTAPDVNLHVFSTGCVEIERMVRFRDRLRRDPADRALYGRAKRELAGRMWRYVQHYADAKTAVIEEILVRAGAPGPVDACVPPPRDEFRPARPSYPAWPRPSHEPISEGDEGCES